MTLTGRFSALFLAALGLVLVGFSTAMYVSARVYLHRQVSERLSAALAVLAAAAEVDAEGVEWEPEERVLSIGQESAADRLRWMVFDDRGRRIDQSRNLNDAELTPAWTPRPGTADLPRRVADRHGHAWRVSQRQIHPSEVHAVPGEPRRADNKYPFLVLTVCAPLEPMETMLAALAGLLVLLSLGLWLLSLLLCRRLSRHALAPLTRMVASAESLDASDPGWQLEEAGTRDELDQLGRSFNGLLSRLHSAFERQRRFSSDASHQLRTPLTVLIGQIEVALRRDRTEDEYRRTLRSALGQAARLGQIVEALLFLARAEGDAQLPPGEPLDLNRWLTEHLALLPESGHALPIVPHFAEGDGVWVRAHPALLGQLLDNLLDNARKYGAPGTVVRVEARRDEGEAVLAVEDSGPGIRPEDIARVFEPFYRSAEARRLGTPGVGLGLAVVQRIALACGGTVRAHSQPGKGCRIEVRLPAIAPGPEETAPARTGSSTPAADIP